MDNVSTCGPEELLRAWCVDEPTLNSDGSVRLLRVDETIGSRQLWRGDLDDDDDDDERLMYERDGMFEQLLHGR